MIFIVLAFFILVISFIIALVTLIREQKGLAGESSNQGAKVDSLDSNKVPVKEVKREENDLAFREKDQSVGLQSRQSQDLPVEARELFPWEENLEDFSTYGQETTTLKKSGNSQDLWENKPQAAGEGEDKSNLSGEISLEDIIKQRNK